MSSRNQSLDVTEEPFGITEAPLALMDILSRGRASQVRRAAVLLVLPCITMQLWGFTTPI